MSHHLADLSMTLALQQRSRRSAPGIRGEPMMNTYNVRYQLDGNEHTETLEAETAAAAAQLVEEHHLIDTERFELLEVHLVEDENDLIRDRQQPA
jgi:hypothetical protein